MTHCVPRSIVKNQEAACGCEGWDDKCQHADKSTCKGLTKKWGCAWNKELGMCYLELGHEDGCTGLNKKQCKKKKKSGCHYFKKQSECINVDFLDHRQDCPNLGKKDCQKIE